VIKFGELSWDLFTAMQYFN